MQAYGSRLKDYYQGELASLREEAGLFAQAYPAEAHALRLDTAGSRDPQVEMLMQSFAFLTGRVRYEMEVSKALLPNLVLEHLYPHLAAPLPPMLVAQVLPKPDDAIGAVLERHRQVSLAGTDEQGNRATCRFRTTSRLPLVPLAVTQAELLQPAGFPPQLVDEACLSALRVRVMRLGTEPVRSLGQVRLRFYLDTTQKDAWFLQEMLGLHLLRVGVRGLAGQEAAYAEPADRELAWLGFTDEEAALPAHANMHPGHRLLQEYFAFPEKFMFFETPVLDLRALEDGFDLLFQFGAPVDAARRIAPQALKLNCVPLVNLYPQRMDPLTLDHTRFEYRLSADVQTHRHCEIYRIEELVAIHADGSLRELRPYFELDADTSAQPQDYFYVTRREESQLGGVAGTEVYASFLDTARHAALPPAEVIAGRALCTNRRLAERIRVGQGLQLEGGGPVLGLEAVSKPSPHLSPTLLGPRPWALASQLSLSHLSLSGGPQALAALKGILRNHLHASQLLGFKHVDGLRRLDCEPMIRHLFRGGMRSFVQGLALRVELDRAQFESGSPVLFASVLRHFLALYAAVNTVVAVTLKTSDTKGDLKQWPPLAGAQSVL